MKVAIYRIIGNAMPRRHGASDFISHIRYIIRNEPDFPSCGKRWILNRIVDPAAKREIVALLEQHGCVYEDIPFDEKAFHDSFYDPAGLPPDLIPRLGGDKEPEGCLERPEVWIQRHRSQHLININHARNLAISRGVAEADWVMPLDGWCYLTQAAWTEIEGAIDGASDARYLIMPLERLNAWPDDEAQLARPQADAEPQIAFRRDAADRFDETLRYGERNKAELLVGLGVPGRWHDWGPDAWDTHTLKPCVDHGRWTMGGWIYRLPSSAAPEVELNNHGRYTARLSGVARLAGSLDQAAMRGMPLPRLACQITTRLSEPPIAEWLRGASVQAEAARLAALPLVTVLDKGGAAPSGLRNDYFSVSRYVHRQGERYVRIDGVSSPANIRGTDESREYDKFSLSDFLAVIATSAMTGRASQAPGGFAPARDWLLAWMVNPETRMRPDARFAQWNPADPGRPSPWGLIDLRDAWMLPPLIQILFDHGALSADERQACMDWCASLCANIASGQQGADAYRHPNNIGTWTHLLLIALAIFSGKYGFAAACLRDVTIRLYQQYGASGEQPRELARATPLHYTLFNLTAWTLMANYLRHYDYELWRYSAGGEPLLTAMFGNVRMDAFAEYEANPRKFDDWMLLLGTLRPDGRRDSAAIAALARIDWTQAANNVLPFNPGSYAFCLACA